MDFHKDYDCSVCHYTCSHPFDQCPVCGDQFYWLVVPGTAATQQEKQQFIERMANLCGSDTTKSFLTHGDHLWLPPNYWTKDGHGEAVSEISWIADLRLFQHETKSTGATPPQNAESLSAANSQEPDTLRVMDAEEVRRTLQSPKPQPASSSPPEVAEPVRAMPLKQRLATWWRAAFVPVMIFLFFTWLALACLVLYYHKNQPRPVPLANFEVIHECTLLS